MDLCAWRSLQGRKVKKLACLAGAAFRAPLLPVYLLAILPLEESSSSLVASNHFGGSTLLADGGQGLAPPVRQSHTALGLMAQNPVFCHKVRVAQAEFLIDGTGGRGEQL